MSGCDAVLTKTLGSVKELLKLEWASHSSPELGWEGWPFAHSSKIVIVCGLPQKGNITLNKGIFFGWGKCRRDLRTENIYWECSKELKGDENKYFISESESGQSITQPTPVYTICYTGSWPYMSSSILCTYSPEGNIK